MTRPARAAWFVFGAALAVRLGFLLAGSAPILWELQGDAAEYRAYASNLVNAGRYEGLLGRKASRMPVYPLFLSGIYATAGEGRWPAALAQAVLGAASCVLVWALAWKWLTPGWALACGLFSAGYYDMILANLSLLSEGLAIFLILSFLLLWFGGAASSIPRALALGITVGLAFMTRAETGPAACAAMLGGFRLTKKTSLVFAAALGLTVAPWVARNWLIFERFMPGTSASAASLYIGVYGTIRDGLKTEVPGAKYELAPPETPEGELTEYYGRKTRQFYGQLRWPLLVKALTFNAAILFYPFLPEFDAPFVFLLPFLAFSLTLWRSRPEIRPLVLFALAMIGQYLLAGQTVSRYRQNLSPLFILLAFSALASRPWPAKALAAWAGVNGAVALWSPQFRQMALWAKGLLWQA